MSTATNAVLSAFASGLPITNEELVTMTGLPSHRVNTYVTRLRQYGDIEKAVCGCKCVKHRITQAGLKTLRDPRERGGQGNADKPLSAAPVSVAHIPNSVFALGGVRA